MKKPTIQANLCLVGHGYQLDIINYVRATPDGNAVEMTSICRDFADSYDVGEIAAAVEHALAKALLTLERDYLRARVLVVRESQDGQSSAISAARTLLVTRPRDKVELHLKRVPKKEAAAIYRLLFSVASEDRFTIVYDEK